MINKGLEFILQFKKLLFFNSFRNFSISFAVFYLLFNFYCGQE